MKEVVLVVEDIPSIAGLIADTLLSLGYISHHCDSISTAKEWLVTNTPKFIYLDIQLSETDTSNRDGIEIAKQYGYKYPCFFLSNLNENEVWKLVGETNFMGRIEKRAGSSAMNQMIVSGLSKFEKQKREQQTTIDVIVKGINQAIKLEDICYISTAKGDSNWIEYHLTNNPEPIIEIGDLKYIISEKLQYHHNFIRIHRSHIVNINKRIKYRNNSIIIKTGDNTSREFPIGETYRDSFLEIMKMR
jgi:CheY-like chemotaxis protein